MTDNGDMRVAAGKSAIEAEHPKPPGTEGCKFLASIGSGVP